MWQEQQKAGNPPHDSDISPGSGSDVDNDAERQSDPGEHRHDNPLHSGTIRSPESPRKINNVKFQCILLSPAELAGASWSRRLLA
jgi:hypothetical protein